LTAETTPEGTISYSYDDAGRRTSMQVAGQTAVSYTYDDADRLTGVTQGSAAVAIAYDDADRRTSLTLPNGIVVEYGYDDDSRLTAITYKDGGTPIGAGGGGAGRIPGGFPLLPIIVNPCLLDPWLCNPMPGRAPCET
jgi:YD repeat-containing protein